MKITATVLMLLSVHFVFGQFSTENIISKCEICTPQDSYAADIDNDGDNDILIASSVDNKISWFENLGDGSFNGPLIISTDVPNASAVLAEDFNGDGFLDLAVSAVNNRRIGIVYGDGAGGFSEPDYTAYLSLLVESMVAADLDNDGDIDIVCAEQGGVSWYENMGNGDFIKRWIDQLSTVKAVQIADIDGDNDLDVLVASNQDIKIAWYENNGDADFSEPIVVTEIGVNVFSISTGDIDNDGDVDVLGKGFFSDRLAWYPNDGAGNFGERIDVSSGQDRGLSTSIIDIDDDGDLDIISASSYDSGQILCYPNDGAGGFPDQLSIGGEISNIESIFTVDLDNDGLLDIVSSAQKYDLISWHQNEGGLNFSRHTLSYIPNHRPSKIVAADIDQNGSQDFAVLSDSDNNIYWYLNDGSSQFIRQDNIPTDLKNLSLDIGLLNEDTYPDILLSNDDGISWVENNGTGGFFEETYVYNDNSNIRRNAIIAELNGDSNNDILICTQYSDNISWIQNTGDGNFASPVTISAELEDPEHLLALDINGDGSQDIISSTTKGQIVFFENLGNGTFSDYNQIDSLGLAGTLIKAADLDNDGDQDIMAIYAQDVQYYRNNGDGTFSDKQIIYEYSSSFFSRNISGIDLDGDGDKDLITGSYDSPTLNNYGVIYFENLGNGDFAEERLIGETGPLNYIYPTDINSDGDYDLLVSVRQGSQISWYENLSDYPTISGNVYYDENTNGILDDSDPGLQNISVSISPDALTSYTDNEGNYRFYVDDGTYTLTTDSVLCWELTSDSSSYTVNVDNSSFSDLNFAYDLSFENPHVQARLYSSLTRCGAEVVFNLNVENDGCTRASGLFGLVLDDLTTYIDASSPPLTISNDTLWWSYSDLLPTESAAVNILLEVAGVNFIGETITIEVLSSIENEGNELIPSGAYLYQSEIRCAYDPNDKTVYPNRLNQYGENFTLFEESLEYIIRFQNTGNDTAFNVVLRDTLNENLDLSTFRPISGSHPFEAYLSENGVLEFYFRDILLPDSTTNEQGSHGYVSYKIKPKPESEEYTEIFNSAGIFFDSNPPIITNTVKSVLVSELPIINSTINQEKGNLFSIHPNPSTGIFTLSSTLNGEFKLDLTSLSGQIIRSYNLLVIDGYTLDARDVPPGIYLVVVKNEDKFGYQKVIISR